MHLLADLVAELISTVATWHTRRVDRSVVGQSRLDREARWIGFALLAIVALSVAGWLYWRS